MGKESQVIEFSGKTKKEIITEMKKILTKGDVMKLCVTVHYREENNQLSQASNFQFSDLKIKQNRRESIRDESYSRNSMKVEESEMGEKSSLEMAIQDYEEGRIEEALEKLQVLEQEYQKKREQKEETYKIIEEFPTITFYIGNCYYELKQYDKAQQYYQKDAENDNKQKAQRMNNLGTCFGKKKEYQKSLKAYNESYKLYSLHPEFNCSGLLYNIGQIYKKSNMFQTAEGYFIQSIDERKTKSPGNERMLFQSYCDLGVCQKELQKYEDSISSFKFAQSYSRKGYGNALKALKQIAKIYESQERWNEALKYYEEISDEYERKNIPQGYVYERVGLIHEKLGNFNAMAKFLKNSFKEYELEGNERKMSELNNTIKRSCSDQS